MYHLVITGTPVEGFKFYGPFLTDKAAREWIAEHCTDLECWVSELGTQPAAGSPPNPHYNAEVAP